MPNIVKKQTPNETEQKVIDYLDSQMIYKWEIVYCGEDMVSEWKHDKWVVIIRRAGDKRAIEQFDYKTGLGHRYLQPFAATEVKRYKLNPGTQAYSSATNNSHYIKQPQIAAVIYCLLLDSEAGNESFSNWCDNFGYDPDSISAFNTYQSCEKTAKQLNNLFNSEQLQTLRDLLQDN